MQCCCDDEQYNKDYCPSLGRVIVIELKFRIAAVRFGGHFLNRLQSEGNPQDDLDETEGARQTDFSERR
jgi:hypothetical protein